MTSPLGITKLHEADQALREGLRVGLAQPSLRWGLIAYWLRSRTERRAEVETGALGLTVPPTWPEAREDRGVPGHHPTFATSSGVQCR